MSSLGKFLRQKREEKGYSLNDVYIKTGVTDSRLSNIEKDRCQEPSPKVLVQLAKLYELSDVELFIKAGYLTDDSLDMCRQIFHGIELLTEEDRKHIQSEIDYIISKHK